MSIDKIEEELKNKIKSEVDKIDLTKLADELDDKYHKALEDNKLVFSELQYEVLKKHHIRYYNIFKTKTREKLLSITTRLALWYINKLINDYNISEDNILEKLDSIVSITIEAIKDITVYVTLGLMDEIPKIESRGLDSILSLF